MMRARILLFCAMALALAGAAASAATFTVTNLNDSGTGSLRDAIAQADATAGADSIDFQAGLTGTIGLASPLPEINDDVTITGPGADLITVSGQNSTFLLLTVGNTLDLISASISGLTFSHGSRGLDCLREATLSMTDCVVSFNDAGSLDGAGLSNTGTATLTRCTFLSNTTDDKGGGIDSGGHLTVTACEISNNAAGEGGGIMLEAGGTLTLSDSTISGNTAITVGGGVLSRGTTPAVVERCSFLNNAASGDGGGYMFEGDGSLTNCTFAGNSAERGGAIANTTGTIDITHCTLYGNSATIDGGGFAGGGTLSLLNTLIASSAGGNVVSGGTVTSLGGNFDSDGSAGLAGPGDQSGTDAAPLDPELAPLQDNGGPTLTFALLPDSPCIDAGLLSTVDVDQRGVTRPQDGDGDGVALPDIGAYEVVPADLSISMGATPTTVKGRKRLTYTITVTNFGPGASTNVVVTDLLPAGTGFAGASAAANGVALPPSVLQTPAFGARGTVVANLGDMALSDTDVVTISVDVFVRKTTISNTATVTSDISDPDAANNTVTVTTVIK